MRLSSFHRGVGKSGLAAAAVLLFAGAAQAQQKAAAAPTFTKDVAPIFQEKCESCHRPDSIAPMSLRTYEEARPWAKAIRTRVSQRQMPPWHIDKGVGIQQFKYDRSLSDAQIDTIVHGSMRALRRATRKTCRRRRTGAMSRRGTLHNCLARPNRI
jgi:mono/diheme cytochrome c family protein